MRIKKRTIILTLMLFVAIISTKAQETVASAGGEASGIGGSSSYTIGQMVYTTQTGTNGNSVAQGVQQPYEISVVSGIPEAKGISLQVSAYPNPTTDYLTVKIDASTSLSIQTLTYQVFDINGKLLQSAIARGTKQSIDMQHYPPGNYFVKVIENKKEIKVFKIIKTN